MSGVILVTGATGKTGAGLIRRLEAAGLPHRAASRRGAVPFDWEQPATWDAALDGVSAVYLVAPGTVADPYGRLQDFAAKAKAMASGARRLVFLGMAGLPAGGPAHGQVHQWLIDNSDDWAVLQPSAFMQNFSVGPSLASIREEDRIYSNTGTGRVPFIDVDDIAAAALAALTAPAPANAAFTLTGGASLSYDRVAELIGDARGRPVAHVQVTTDEMAERLIARGLPEFNARLLAFGYQTIAAGAQDRVSDDVLTLTGRAPKTFEVFAAENAGVWGEPGFLHPLSSREGAGNPAPP